MIILKNNNITIPRGISPSFITTDHEISLQKKSVTINKNGVATIVPDSEYDALSSVKVTAAVHVTPKLQNIVKTYVENGHYTINPGENYDGIGNVSITIHVPETVFKTQDKSISISENGDYSMAPDASYDGIGNVSISVNVPERVINLQDKNENIVSNGDYRYTADSSYDGLGVVNVHVNVPEKKIILQNKEITENGSVTYDEGFDGLGTVNVNVPIPEYKSQTKEASYDKNGSFTLKPDSSFDGISQANITVNVPEKIFKTQDKTISISENGDYSVAKDSSFDGMNNVSITVNVPSKDPTLQEKTIDASSLYNETKDIITETIIPDNDFDGLSKVTYTRLNLAKNRTTAVGTLPPMSGSYVFFKPEKGFDGFLNFGFRINYQEPTVDPSTSQQLIEPSTGYACFKNVTVNPVTSAIDSNIKPANIKKGVSILGVEGTYETTKTQEKTLAKSDLINHTNKSVTVELVPDSSFAGMSKITYPKINLNNNFTVEFRTPSDDKFAGLNLNVPVAGFDGVSRFSYKTRRQDKTVTPSTTKQTVNCDSGYVGIRSVTVNPVDKIPLRYIECDGNTFFKLISTNDTLNLLNSYTCDIQCSFTQTVSIAESKTTLLSFENNTGSSYESEVIVKFGSNYSGSNMLETYVHGEDKNITIINNYSQYTLGNETCIDVQIHNSVDSSTASKKFVVSDISGANGSNINTTLPNELIAFGAYDSSGKLVCTSSSGYRIHRIILHRDQIAAQTDKTRTYYEFIPVLHDGKPCFFETSTKTYRYNLGTGTPKYELL